MIQKNPTKLNDIYFLIDYYEKGNIIIFWKILGEKDEGIILRIALHNSQTNLHIKV